MKAKKALGAGLVGLSLPMLVAGMSMVGPAFGVDSTNTTAAELQSTVMTEDQCEWRVANAPSGLTLTTTEEYELTDLALTATVTDLTVYSTGNTHSGDESSYTDCVFYGAVLEPTLTMELDGVAVDAHLSSVPLADDTDTSMDFQLSAGNPLTISSTGTCTGWTISNLSLSAIGANSVLSTTTIKDNVESSGAGNDICAVSQLVTLTVPGGKTPSAPGSNYTFVGPSITTVLSQPPAA